MRRRLERPERQNPPHPPGTFLMPYPFSISTWLTIANRIGFKQSTTPSARSHKPFAYTSAYVL
jgi:hypothetical protein